MMFHLSAVFEILGVGRQQKQAAARALFPGLYQMWLETYARGKALQTPDKLEEALFWRIITGKAAKEYYRDALAFFGFADAGQQSDALFSQRCGALSEALESLTDAWTDRAALEALQSGFQAAARGFDARQQSVLMDLARLLQLDRRAFSEQLRSQSLQLCTYYLVLALTAIPKKGDAAAAAAAIRRHCEATDFSGKTLLQKARERHAADPEQAEQLLQEAWESELVGGQTDYVLAQLKRAELDRARAEEKRRAVLAEYASALDESCRQKYPPALIERARESFLGGRLERNLSRCVLDCETILSAPDRQIQRVLGEAYWLLFQLTEAGDADALALNRRLRLGGAEQLLERSCEQNWRAAIELRSEREARQSVSLIHMLRHSDAKGYGTAFFNCAPEEETAEILRRTRPEGWDWMPFEKHALFRELTQDDAAPIRFFLVSPDEEKNLKDALAVLQTVKLIPSLDPARVSICLIGNEARVSPLLDTAQEHMDGRIVPVAVLDPDKNAAQQLLSRHPLFYPIRDVKQIYRRSQVRQHGGETERIFTLRFVITGATRCCEWLVREAYWMMTFRMQNLVRIRSEITILAPDATALLDRICCSNPGMGAARSTGTARDASQSILLHAEDLQPDTPEYRQAVLDAFTAEHSACYFAVDAGSDLQNLEHAIRLRETLTREWIRRDTPRELEPPVVAFRCADSDLANLSRETVVLNENLGSAWYNHYRLIPFGTASDLYSWQQLTDSVQNQISFCNHLQYYRLDVEGEGEPPQEEKRRAAWEDYHRRSYNRESSFEVALSMPYRLYNSHFDTVEKDTTGTIAVGMTPERWDILDRDAYWSEQARLRFAADYDRAVSARADKTEDYSGAVIASDELREIAEWEHARWNRYMISRGWIAATPEQTKAYRRAGNGRWQLYIGRMHPCIIPFADLPALAAALNADENQNLDFTQIDFRNVRVTGSLLALTWLRLEDAAREQGS